MNLGTFVDAVRKAKKTSSHPFIEALDVIVKREAIQVLLPAQPKSVQLPPMNLTLEDGKTITSQPKEITLTLPIVVLSSLPNDERYALLTELFKYNDLNPDTPEGQCHQTLVTAFKPEFISLCRALYDAGAMREENVNWLGNQLDTDLLSPNLFMQTQSRLGARPAAERYLQALRNLVRDGTLTADTESWIHPTDNTAFQAMYDTNFSAIEIPAEQQPVGTRSLAERVDALASFGLLTPRVINAIVENSLTHGIFPDRAAPTTENFHTQQNQLVVLATQLVERYAGARCTERNLLDLLANTPEAAERRSNLSELIITQITFTQLTVPIVDWDIKPFLDILLAFSDEHRLTPARSLFITSLARHSSQYKKNQYVPINYSLFLTELKIKGLLPIINKEDVPPNTKPDFYGDTPHEFDPKYINDSLHLRMLFMLLTSKRPIQGLTDGIMLVTAEGEDGTPITLDEETRNSVARLSDDNQWVLFLDEIPAIITHVENMADDFSHYILGKIYNGELFEGGCPDEILNTEKAFDHFSQVSEDSEYHADSLEAMYCIVSKSEEDGISTQVLTDNTLADATYLAAQHKLTVPDTSLTFFQHAMTDTQRLRKMATNKDDENGNDLKADYALRVFGLK
ncbi:MAG: hypothetical protein DHS20C10_06000 [marine bacterium B5-7]|nr:MAG: hypothetical protein DHS20C10_06000 [marine bacterium B5-7]